MRHRLPLLGAVLGFALVLASCGQESSSSGGVTYKDVKSMVIDILGSEEAQKAIQKASEQTAGSGSAMLIKSNMTPQDQATVRIAVKDVLTSPEYSKVLEMIMKDPKFAGEFAKAINEDNKQIHKDLLKDPSYQKDLVDVFKNPEAQKILADSMKTTEFRKQMMAGVTEAIQSPLFKLEIMKMLQSVVRDELTPKPAGQGQGGQGQGGGGQGGGGDKGGGGGQGGGGGGG